MEVLIAKRFEIGRTCGPNPTSTVYKAVDNQTNEKCVVKLESIKTRNVKLMYEFKIIKTFEGCEGFPKPIWFGVEGDYNVMATQRLGESLESLLRRNEGRFSMKTTLQIGEKIINLVERMHEKGYLHRDLNPGNFLFGYKELQSSFYTIGLGLAKRYRNPRTGDHIPYKEHQKLKGNPRYVTLNTHNGVDQSRRDDLESLGYLLIYLVNGVLPWQGVKAANKAEKLAKIKNLKNLTSEEALCESLPRQFYEYLKYCKGLSFESEPDYGYLRGLLHSAADDLNLEFDGVYDWADLCFSGDEGYEEPSMFHADSLDTTMCMMNQSTNEFSTRALEEDFELIN